MNKLQTVCFRVYGIVQGVGFRPTVDRHAAAAGIRGSVCNKGPYVEILAQGSQEELGHFRNLLQDRPPRRAAILKIDEKPVPDAGEYSRFSIIESEKTNGEIYISPDIAICEECERELYDPSDRRYLHPFINCTCCGPRMTILDALPYDRERTSMKMFPMCRPCAEEYHGSWSRRYDAQPVCCNDCGPEVYLLQPASADKNGKGRKDGTEGRGGIGSIGSTGSTEDIDGIGSIGSTDIEGIGSIGNTEDIDGIEGRGSLGSIEGIGIDGKKEKDGDPVSLRMTRGGVRAEIIGREAITAARSRILDGGIVAVKGIGGFHLCCDATNEEAVQKLRTRKRRPAKPFAVMMRDQETVRRECLFNEEQGQILTGHQKPILLLERRKTGGNLRLAEAVAPGNPKVGVMLPYAPLHHLLFSYDDGLTMPDCLVMTSGNVSGAPICRDDRDALTELSGFCDCILSHDRLIRIRADDSVMDFHRRRPYMIRRSRGYAPLPILLTPETQAAEQDRMEKGSCVLAVGGELKNSFCIASGDLFYLSPYVGDLEDLRTVRALQETIRRMETLLEVKPRAVVCDLHPKYNATMVAEEIAAEQNIPLYRIQHHYAHILSCMAENDRRQPVVGVSFDGTGFGEDGTIWGGEIMTADYHGYRREYSIAPFIQIGGDSAPRQGWRIAASMIWSVCKSAGSGEHPGFAFTSGSEGLSDAISGSASPLLMPGTGTASRPDPAEIYFSIIEELALCDTQNAKAQRMMAERGIQAVTSTSAGRLFDAVSAMLGICRTSTYEGEASIELEFAAERYAARAGLAAEEEGDSSLCDPSLRDSFLCDSSLCDSSLFAEMEKVRMEYMEKTEQMEEKGENCRHLPTDRLFSLLLCRRLQGEDPEKLAYIFHVILADLVVEACARICRERQISAVALTGGCYQNRLLLTLTEDGLRQRGLEVLIHHLVPPNDGGIALGQAAAVMMRHRSGIGTSPLPQA